jgi:transcriptional regulator with XRE-family HTH domain
MTDEASKILKSARKERGLSIRSFTDEVNTYLPEGFHYSFVMYSKWERGVSALPIYVFLYLAQHAAGWVQEMAQEIINAMQVVAAAPVSENQYP